MTHGFLGTIGWIKGNLMTSSQASEKGYSNENFYPGAPNIPESEPTLILESILPTMTSATSPSGYVVSASDWCTSWSSEIEKASRPYLAFDKKSNTRWLSEHTKPFEPHWIQIGLPSAQEVAAFSINMANANYTESESDRNPKIIEFSGSNDNHSFTLIKRIEDIPQWDASDVSHEPIVYKLAEPVSYKYYRLEVIAVQSDSRVDCHIGEFDLLSYVSV